MMLFIGVLSFFCIFLCNGNSDIPSDNFKQSLRAALLSTDVSSSNENLVNEYIDFYMVHRNNNNLNQDINNNNNNNINSDVLQQRFKKYVENLEYINTLNADISNPNAGGYGITEFMDWFDDEINAMYMNDVAMEEELKNNNNENNNNLMADVGNTCKAVNSYPIDNNRVRQNNPWGISKCRVCKHQYQSNMCWSFASTLEFECNACKQLHRCEEFSEQYGIDCSRKYGTWGNNQCNTGGYPDRLGAYYRDYGACSKYPSGDFNGGRCNYCQNCKSTKLRSRNCYNLRNNNAAIVTSVANKYAMTFIMKVGKDWSFWKATKAYVSCPYGSNGNNHVMTIIGQRYGRELLIQNSWGCGWGQSGKAWISTSLLSQQQSKCVVYNTFIFSSWYNSLEFDDINNDIEVNMIDHESNYDDNKEAFVDQLLNNNNNNNINIDKNMNYYYYGFIALFLLSIISGISYYICNRNKNKNLNFVEEYEPLSNAL